MFGLRLKLVRKQRGFSLKALAARMSPPLSAQAISKYEQGKMLPKSSVLVQLGKELDVSLDFLMGGQIESLTSVAFRKKSNTTVRDRAEAEAVVIEHLEDYFTIEEILGLKYLGDPFDELGSSTVSNFQEIEERASSLRNKWTLGDGPIPSMMEVLESKNFKVVEADLPAHFDGLACSVQRTGNRPTTQVIVISSKTTIERKRFNLAHELAHHVVHETSSADLPLEKAMQRFAAAFLVPEDHLKSLAGEHRSTIPYRELVTLKWLYGISASAMLMRLADVEILSPETVQYAFRTYANGWRKLEPEPIENGQQKGMIETPLRYNNLVWRALGEKLISPVRAAQMLHCSLDEIKQGLRG